VNLRIWNCAVRESLSVMSIAPLHFGPIYLWRVTGWKIGSKVVGQNLDGTIGPSGKGIKMASNNAPEARIVVAHCDFDIDQTDPNGVTWAGISNTGSTFRPGLWIKNNILTATTYAIDAVTVGRFTEDHNLICTSDTTRGIRVGVTTISTTPTDYDNTSGRTFAAYRAATGQGTNSNKDGAGVTQEVNAATWVTEVRAQWTDRATGDLTLAAGATASINRGTPIPNISDQPGVSYLGSAPDLGALERE
jgi:hypothetical protein